MAKEMIKLMNDSDAPDEQYLRVGLPKDGNLTIEDFKACGNILLYSCFVRIPVSLTSDKFSFSISLNFLLPLELEMVSERANNPINTITKSNPA